LGEFGEGVLRMDIQIKYKEMDKKAMVAELVSQAVKEGMNHNGKFRDKLVNQIMSVMIDDSVYNQTRQREIESVTIENPFEVGEHIFKANIIKGKRNDSIYLSMPVVWRQDKSCLKEFIDILTKIHDQMD
jgi:hypothetical protein